MDKVQEWKNVMDAWEILLQSPDEESYLEHLKNFTNQCTHFKLLVDYVQNTWLMPFKEKFVHAWVN